MTARGKHRLLQSGAMHHVTAELLVPESPYEIKQNTQHHAQQDGGGQRKVKCGVFAAINNVAGKTTDREMRAPQQDERDPGHDNDCAEQNQ